MCKPSNGRIYEIFRMGKSRGEVSRIKRWIVVVKMEEKSSESVTMLKIIQMLCGGHILTFKGQS